MCNAFVVILIVAVGGHEDDTGRDTTMLSTVVDLTSESTVSSGYDK